MKGQMTLIGIIQVLIGLLVLSVVFFPIYKDMVANHTTGFNSFEITLFGSIGTIVLFGLIMSILWYSSAQRERVYD